MRLTHAASLFAAVASSPFAGAASAGVIITLSQVEGTAPPKPMTMYCDADKFRMDFDPQGVAVIFRGDLGKMWVLTAKTKTYLEITPETAARLASAASDAMALARQKLAALPEAQRKQIEALMASKTPALAATPPAPPTYEKAGDNRTVGEWTCAPYRIIAGDKLSGETCIAKIEDLGLTADDLKPLARYGAFAAKLRGAMAPAGGPLSTGSYDAMRKAIGFDGFPVESKLTIEGGARTLVNTLQSIRHDDLAAATFDLPEGYMRRDLPAPIGGPPSPQP